MDHKIKIYVAGFLFNDSNTKVVLIKKARPDWQKNKYNAVGGKVDFYDTSYANAMEREFTEETGVKIPMDQWQNFCTLHGKDYYVKFFRAFVSDEILNSVKSITDESIEIFDIDAVSTLGTVKNLSWLLPLALDKNIKQGDIFETT